MRNYRRISVARPDGDLSVLVSGNESARAVILLHGMRDHAHSMIDLAKHFDPEYRIILPDLRGHGESSSSGGYSMIQFVADIRSVVCEFNVEKPILIGHSLGGHVLSRYTASYPEEVEALVLLDGMGPPSEHEPPSALEIRNRWHAGLNTVVDQFNWLKPMADLAEAQQRLCRNNPGLSDELAQKLVAEGVKSHPDGGIRWKWDPTVNMVWQTFSHQESETLMQFITCPTLIVTGDNGLSYWINGRFDRDISEDWYQSELSRRVQLFGDARSVVIADAGHMLHYDQPDEVNRVIREFLQNR